LVRRRGRAKSYPAPPQRRARANHDIGEKTRVDRSLVALPATRAGGHDGSCRGIPTKGRQTKLAGVASDTRKRSHQPKTSAQAPTGVPRRKTKKLPSQEENTPAQEAGALFTGGHQSMEMPPPVGEVRACPRVCRSGGREEWGGCGGVLSLATVGGETHRRGVLRPLGRAQKEQRGRGIISHAVFIFLSYGPPNFVQTLSSPPFRGERRHFCPSFSRQQRNCARTRKAQKDTSCRNFNSPGASW